jgi:hypothetical protein
MLLICLILALFITSNCSSPERKYERFSFFSAVRIPRNLYPIEELEEWCPNGDGFYLARFLIEDETLVQNLKNDILGNNGQDLPFEGEIIDDLIIEYLDKSDQGYYLLNIDQNDPGDIKLIVLNLTTQELIFLI